MKFSEQWLRELVDPDLSTDELLQQLTMAGLEVDGYEPVAGNTTQVIVGEIEAVNKHPDADKLVVCTVNHGAGTHQVVCGAPNARPGIKVPFALVGAQLDDFKIKKAKLRGVESFGMLCSEREIGISDDHEGLMELAADAPTGTDIREYLKLDDVIVDLDLTPNRSDCLGIVGLARETALINELDWSPIDPPSVTPVIDDTFPVTLDMGSGCPQFVGRVVKGIDTGQQSPLWMREKLRRSGVRSIDPVVDVTNYVMLEMGQPMHAYDLSRLSGRIVVRTAGDNEELTLLDEQKVSIEPGTLLITDESGPIGLAGIMGGLSTAVSATSVDIFLEAAFFDPATIAGRARAHGLNTDASHRFERGVDWQGQVAAMERATALLLDIVGGSAGPIVATALDDELPVLPVINLRSSRVAKLLGIGIGDKEIEKMLSRLGLSFETMEDLNDSTWQVTSASHRFDLTLEEDLVEEISRIYGYNNLPLRTPNSALVMPRITETALSPMDLKRRLVSRGYFEAVTYSFVDPAVDALLDPTSQPVPLANPLSSEMAVMRSTLWPGLIKSLIYNSNRQQEQVRLFEMGQCFRLSEKGLVTELDQITQEMMLAGVTSGLRTSENWASKSQPIDFYDVKADIEAILSLSGLGEYEFRKTDYSALHPGQSAEIRRRGELVGHLGMIHPRIREKLDLPPATVVFQCRVPPLLNRLVPVTRDVSRFPAVRRDIAMLVPTVHMADEITERIKNVAGNVLINLKLFDVYQGKGIDPTRKSLGFGLTFQDPSRNLTDDEISQIVDDIVTALAEDFGAEQR